ncbi:hypothetical protein [Actinocrinis sp.]|uniref:hypothetical protein n=1 Tax=Actinocrinis sp. TaxID=1920516 RepID=UPI002DDCFF28|nr:hypothetical protein [Actinocrinis sp.]
MRRYEFDLYRADIARRLKRLEQYADDHDKEHDQDEENAAQEAREKSRWTRSQIVAVIAAAATLLGLWLQATAR